MYPIAKGVSRTSLSALFTPEVGSSSHACRHCEHFQNRVSVQLILTKSSNVVLLSKIDKHS